MTRAMTTTEIDQRAQLAALMAPKPDRGLDPSELAPATTDYLIRKTCSPATSPKPDRSPATPAPSRRSSQPGKPTARTKHSRPARSPTPSNAGASPASSYPSSTRTTPRTHRCSSARSTPPPCTRIRRLHVKGRLDLQSRRGSEVYDLLKRGAPLGWTSAPSSKANTLKDAATLIRKVSELMEVSLTPTPANGGVRTIAIKGIEVPRDDKPSLPTRAEIEARLMEAGLLADPAADAIRDHAYRHTMEVLTRAPTARPAPRARPRPRGPRAPALSTSPPSPADDGRDQTSQRVLDRRRLQRRAPRPRRASARRHRLRHRMATAVAAVRPNDRRVLRETGAAWKAEYEGRNSYGGSLMRALTAVLDHDAGQRGDRTIA